MSWHYQIRRKSVKGSTSTTPYYEIVEVYNRPYGYTEGPSSPLGESRRGLIRDLEMMLHDAKKYRTLIVKR
jgi:hypothetical protein